MEYLGVEFSAERFWALVNHPWFEITGKGWVLTARGRVEGLSDVNSERDASAGAERG